MGLCSPEQAEYSAKGRSNRRHSKGADPGNKDPIRSEFLEMVSLNFSTWQLGWIHVLWGLRHTQFHNHNTKFGTRALELTLHGSTWSTVYDHLVSDGDSKATPRAHEESGLVLKGSFPGGPGPGTVW